MQSWVVKQGSQVHDKRAAEPLTALEDCQPQAHGSLRPPAPPARPLPVAAGRLRSPAPPRARAASAPAAPGHPRGGYEGRGGGAAALTSLCPAEGPACRKTPEP